MTSKTLCILLLCVTGFVFTGLPEYFPQMPGPAQIVLSIAGWIVPLALIYAWVRIDAAEREFRVSTLLSLGIFALAAVCVPVYLLRSRPEGARLRAVGGAVGVFALWMVSSLAGSLVAVALKGG